MVEKSEVSCKRKSQEGKKKQMERGRSRLPCREPDAKLNPWVPGSHAEPKADSQWLSHPSVPDFIILLGILF